MTRIIYSPRFSTFIWKDHGGFLVVHQTFYAEVIMLFSFWFWLGFDQTDDAEVAATEVEGRDVDFSPACHSRRESLSPKLITGQNGDIFYVVQSRKYHIKQRIMVEKCLK